MGPYWSYGSRNPPPLWKNAPENWPHYTWAWDEYRKYEATKNSGYNYDGTASTKRWELNPPQPALPQYQTDTYAEAYKKRPSYALTSSNKECSTGMCPVPTSTYGPSYTPPYGTGYDPLSRPDYDASRGLPPFLPSRPAYGSLPPGATYPGYYPYDTQYGSSPRRPSTAYATTSSTLPGGYYDGSAYPHWGGYRPSQVKLQDNQKFAKKNTETPPRKRPTTPTGIVSTETVGGGIRRTSPKAAKSKVQKGSKIIPGAQAVIEGRRRITNAQERQARSTSPSRKTRRGTRKGQEQRSILAATSSEDVDEDFTLHMQKSVRFQSDF